MHKSIIIVLILFSLIIINCSTPDNNSEKKNVKEKIETIICKSDSTQSYEIYLPENYSSDKQYPVIFCFDPHARGIMPVDLLKKSAKNYGYIIASSNNSKNNLPQTQYVIDIFLNDVLSHYSINKNRIYTIGFSGGGRIAGNIALQKNIEGVISCAAGIPQQNISQLQHHLNYYGIVGNEDFNYREMIDLRKLPTLKNLNIHVQIFSGKHDWPPSQYLDEALLWMEFNAMREKLIPTNKSLVNLFFQETEITINEKIKNKEYVQAFFLTKKGISFLKGLKNVKKFNDIIIQISKDKGYLEQNAHIEKLYNQESLLRNSLLKDFQNKDVEWWKNTISSLKTMIDNNNQENEKRLLISRVVNYLSMVSYIYTNKSLTNKDLEPTRKYLKIYEMIDPKNPDCQYFKALNFSLNHQLDSAKVSYRKAIEYGFYDFERAKKELSLDILNQ